MGDGSGRRVVDVASSIVGAVLGVAVGGVFTLYGVRAAIDWAITRAVQAG
ncbi:hypothetical protein ACFW81_23910 [Streptomyces angustmyceticus]